MVEWNRYIPNVIGEGSTPNAMDASIYETGIPDFHQANFATRTAALRMKVFNVENSPIDKYLKALHLNRSTD